MLLILLFDLVTGGLLAPVNPKPIQLSTNNIDQHSDYTFFFQISSYVPESSVLRIKFPKNNYQAGLGMVSCVAENWNQQTVSCSVSGTTLEVTLSEMSNAEPKITYSVKVFGVQNPGSRGGTGMFSLETRKGVNILDYNDYFGEIGLTEEVSAIVSASVACDSNCKSGQVAQYTFSYNNVVNYLEKTRIFIEFPSTLQLGTACSSPEIPGIKCSVSNKLVSIEKVPEIPSGTSISVTFSSVQNPPYSGSVGNFKVWTYSPKVETKLEESASVPGPTVIANDITNIEVCPSGSCTQNYPRIIQGNSQTYYLSVTTTNPVPNGGVIVIDFLSSFQIRQNSCLVTSGLQNQDYTEEDQVLCELVSSELRISKFAEFQPGTFELQLIAQNPSPGTHSPISVSTFYDSSMTKEIDNGSMGSVVVESTSSLDKFEISWSGSLNVNAGVTASIIFRPTTDLNCPDVSIEMEFGDSFGFNGSPSGKLIPHNVYPGLAITPAWSSGTLTIPTTGTSILLSNEDNQVEFGSSGTGLVLPSTPGTYFFEVTIKTTTGHIEAKLFEMEVLPDSLSGSLEVFSDDVEAFSIYEVSFTPSIDIPAGKVPEVVSDSWGTIDLLFPTLDSNLQYLWKADLGTSLAEGGIVPCKGIQNIQPYQDNISCKLIPATSVATDQYSVVRVTNFAAIYRNLEAKLHISKIQNIQTAQLKPEIQVKTYSINQRKYQLLNSGNFQLPRVSYQDNDPDLPPVNGRSPPPYGDSQNTITFSPNTVNSQTVLSFTLWTEKPITTGGSMILKFPQTFPLPHTEINCYINYSQKQTCYTYPDAAWIGVTTSVPVTDHEEYSFTITGLKIPSQREEPQSVQMVLVSSHKESEYSYFTELNYFEPGNIESLNVWSDSKEAMQPGVTYTWQFTLTNSINKGGFLVLTFPKENYVLDLSPSPTCEVSSGLSGQIQCSVARNSVKVLNFESHTAGNEIRILIYKVLNPQNQGPTGKFSIESYSEHSKLVDAIYDISGVVIESKSKIGTLKFLDFFADPLNGNSLADYTLSLKPSKSIPEGSVIKVTFTGFAALPNPASCSVSGGLETFESCLSTGNTISVTTDLTYEKNSISQPINMTFYGIQNFAPNTTSDLVEVKISNAGVTLEETPTSEENRKITTLQEPKSLELLSLSYSPVTPAQRSEYNFTFSVQSGLECPLVIEFPQTYPRGLAQGIKCYSTELSSRFDSQVSCKVESRKLEVYNTQLLENFTLSVRYIHNPNTGNAQQKFSFYTKCGYQMLSYGEYINKDMFQIQPLEMFLDTATIKESSISYSSEEVTLAANSSFVFSGADTDRIIVDFPSDYKLDYLPNNLFCDSGCVNGNSEPCTYSSNRVFIQGFVYGTSCPDQLVVNLKGLENPHVEGQADYISVSIYNGVTQRIFAKTFPNLNVAEAFSYQKKGREILMNQKKEFSVAKGTMTNSMTAQVEGGASASLKFKGQVSETECRLEPQELSFEPGEDQKTWAVSCSPSASTGEHYIHWSFDENLLDYYSPITRSVFYVEEGFTELISASSIGVVPLGGQSFPVTVSLSRPPNFLVKVVLSKVGVLPTGAVISPDVLEFVKGETTKDFNVEVSLDSYGLEGKVRLSVYGQNAKSYSLEEKLLTYTVGKKDAFNPLVIDYQTAKVSRTSATFSVVANEPCNVYWMLSKHGTRQPTLAEIKAQALNETGLEDQPRFGRTYSYAAPESNRFFYTVSVSGLVAQTNYSMFFEVVDLGGNKALESPFISFSTLDRFRSAAFTLEFTEEIGNVEEVLQLISQLLQVKPERVIQRKDYSGSTGSAPKTTYHSKNYTTSSGISRRLQGTTQLDVVVLPDPHSPSQNSPKTIAESLDLQVIAKRFPEFKKSSSPQEIYGVQPLLKTKPRIVSAVSSNLVVSDLSLFEPGKVSLCLTKYKTSMASPVPSQIVNKLNPRNHKCEHFLKVEANSVPQEVSFDQIAKDTEYRLFVSAENTLEGYPDIMDYVYEVAFTTYGMNDEQSFLCVLSLSLMLLI